MLFGDGVGAGLMENSLGFNGLYNAHLNHHVYGRCWITCLLSLRYLLFVIYTDNSNRKSLGGTKNRDFTVVTSAILCKPTATLLLLATRGTENKIIKLTRKAPHHPRGRNLHLMKGFQVGFDYVSFDYCFPLLHCLTSSQYCF